MTMDFNFDLDAPTAPAAKKIESSPLPSSNKQESPLTKEALNIPKNIETAKVINEPKNGEDKPRLRQSNLVHYFTCPKKYLLATEHPEAFEPTMPMRQGLIFERYVLGEKPDHNEADFRANVYGRINPDTLEFIKAQAELVKEYFIQGKPFVKLAYDAPHYYLKGEADFIGEVVYKGVAINCIADLKYTANISEYWNKKLTKADFLQAVVYPFLYFKQTGIILPFVYIVVENSYKEPLVKQILITCNEEDFKWLEIFIYSVINDAFFEPKDDARNCLGYKGFGKCKYLEFCDEGKELICEPLEAQFSALQEPNANE